MQHNVQLSHRNESIRKTAACAVSEESPEKRISFNVHEHGNSQKCHKDNPVDVLLFSLD